MRQPRFHTLAGTIALALLVARAAPALAQNGRVGGLVRDESGQGIKGATITAENPNIGQSFTASTDDKGRFTMIGLRAGTWRFIAAAPGYSPEAGEAAIRIGGPNPPITFALKKSGNAFYGALGGIAAKDLQADLTAADNLFNQKKWDEAISAYRTILGRAPALNLINLQIAAAYRQKNDYDGAISAYNELLKNDSGNEKAHVGIAEALIEKGDVAAAERSIELAAQAPAAGPEVLYDAGEVKFSKGDTDGAVRWYRKAADADPSWGKPLYKLGVCAQKQGDAAAAAKLFQQVIAVDPVSPEAGMARSSLDSLNK